jgi:hypothetical protein
MNCCQCQGIEEVFDARRVRQEVKRYRAKGPIKTTRLLIDALKAEGIEGLSLLDIGGGVGAIQHELLRAGVPQATSVEASSAYLEAARAEAERRGIAARVSYRPGNFVDVAASVPPADIVTLDRVICCFPDMEALVSRSVARAGRLYGLVYPRDAWWVRAGVRLQNFILRLRRSAFRSFAHPTAAVEALVTGAGFKRRFYRQTLIWQVVVYRR